MAHFRTQIRDKVAALLADCPTTAGRVFSGRVAPLMPAEMPGLVVVSAGETADFGPSVGGGPSTERVLQLLVIGDVVGNEGLYDDLDSIAGEVEKTLLGDHYTLDGLCQWIEPPQTQLAISERGENSSDRIGTIRLVFPIHYRTVTADPSVQV